MAAIVAYRGDPSNEPGPILRKGGPAMLSALLRGCSVEVAPRDRASLQAAISQLAPGTLAFIPAIAGRAAREQVEVARALKSAGLIPVPHIAARDFRNRSTLGRHLRDLSREAGVVQALLLAGDRRQPVGEFHDSQQMIGSGLLQDHGFRGIAIATYPEGHPNISSDVLEMALLRKLAAARAGNLAVELVTQFCPDPTAIVRFARELRRQGVVAPLRIGVAGVARRASLLKYALLCGVGPSINLLRKPHALIGACRIRETPATVLTAMAEAMSDHSDLDIGAVHFFTFGSLARTARWIRERCATTTSRDADF